MGYNRVLGLGQGKSSQRKQGKQFIIYLEIKAPYRVKPLGKWVRRALL